MIRIWVISTSILFCLCAAWSFVTPVGAANDEPAQLVKAASVVRGQFVGSTLTPTLEARLNPAVRASLQNCEGVHGTNACDRAITVVTVPESFANFAVPSCRYLIFQNLPADCGHGLRGSGREAIGVTYVGRYPPLYYAIVGLPSLVWHTNTAVYLMRLLSGLLCSMFLGLAIALAALWSRSRLLVLAVAVTASPMAIIFGSVVNPSGLEIATATCVWTGGLILVLDRTSEPPTSLVAATAIAASVMVLSRGLSPLWLAVIGGFLAALAPRSLRELLRSRTVRAAAGAVGLATLLAVGYIVWAHALSVYPAGQPVPAGTSGWGIILLALGRTGLIVNEFVGTLGWTFTSSPLLVMGLWVFSASTVLVLGLTISLRRHAAVIVALIVASLVVPTALMVSQAHKDGLVWQARDGFPLYAGPLLVAGAVAFRSRAPTETYLGGAPNLQWGTRRLALLLSICVATVQIGDFVWSLRRYTVGLGSTINPFAHGRATWSPPIPPIILFLLMGSATIVYCWWIVVSTVGPDGSGVVHGLRPLGKDMSPPHPP
jgi:hypothetical protein